MTTPVFPITAPDGRISPPDLAPWLFNKLRDKYPNADSGALFSCAADVDRQVCGLVRSGYSIKVGIQPKGWKNLTAEQTTSAVSCSLVEQRSVIEGLNRLLSASSSESNWLWSKAWQEAPSEAIALLEHVAGSEAVWGKVPAQSPIDPRWEKSLVNAGAKLAPHEAPPQETEFAFGVTGAPIPHPRSIAPLLKQALQCARKHEPRFRRDIHVAAIKRAYERLTGAIVHEPRYEDGRRQSPFIDFLAVIESFYTEQYLPPFSPFSFHLPNSGSWWTSMLAL